jgi:autotransporter-associated beta strand protein
VHFHAPVTFDTYDSAAATARTVIISADVEDGKTIGTYSGGRYDLGGAIIKKNAGTLVVSGYNTFTGGTTVNGGTLLAAHDHALGTGAASVGAGGTLELMEGVSVTNAVTLAANATLLIDGAEARTAAGTSVVGTIATPSTGTANLKVVGDLSEETQNISIMLGALAEGASVEALTLDATELTLPKAGWRARLKAREGALVLDVKNPTGMTLIVR